MSSRPLRALLPFVCLILLLVLPSSAQAFSLRANLAQPYVQRDGAMLRYDLIRPADNHERPAIVLVHGGGWWFGDRKDLWKQSTHLHQRLAQAGFVVISPDYRLTCGVRDAPRTMYGYNYNRHGYPLCGRNYIAEQALDLQEMVRYMRLNEKALGIDADRIGMLGVSAGGHLALMAAASAPVDAQVLAVSNWSGPVSTGFITRQDPHPTRDRTILPAFANAVGCLHAACPERWQAADPTHVLAQIAPSFAIQNVVGQLETQVTVSSVVTFHRLMQRRGWKSEAALATGNCHGTSCANQRVYAGARRGANATSVAIAFMRSSLARRR